MSDLWYIGSYQDGIIRINENPREEVWSQIARYGSAEWLQTGLTVTKSGLSLAQLIDYSGVRVRQAVEFRNASRATTLLTAPLPLYYSFLNLLRAFLAMKEEVISTKGHGLSFQLGADFLSSKAVISKTGTFPDYLKAINVPFQVGMTITLEECLALIPEVSSDYSSLRRSASNAVTVEVRGKMSGKVSLEFIGEPSEADFRQNWSHWYPKLASVCTLEPSGTALRVNAQLATYEAVVQFCNEFLVSHLVFLSNQPRWFAIKQLNSSGGFPRPAYYFIALHILGSIVRYEPEVMLPITKPESEIGWFLGRFLRTAERFYPQLMLAWLEDRFTFF